MGQAGSTCRGHQLATTQQHEQPGPLSPHLQALTTPSSLASPTISPRGPSRPVKSKAGIDVSRRLWAPITSLQQLSQCTPKRDPSPTGVPPPAVAANRLRLDAAGAPLVLKRPPQVQPGSTTVPRRPTQTARPPHTPRPSGRLLTSLGSSSRRRTVLQGHPGSGTRPPPRVLCHYARPRYPSAQTSRPDPHGRGPPQKVRSRPRQASGLHGPRSDRPQGNAASLSPQVVTDKPGAELYQLASTMFDGLAMPPKSWPS
ncbi:hypothetical protein NDU88_006391 [Pleurodeles waltl]|uniref:Uncharacterized protein n=1 Tax=Pleurodeles waltl TaxID=8319 RepID=A0AAV7WG62_PLEWA|nr:hypothetical protein NDU88_006391 [Pleurodeles waltl]